jgi:hypothetical protein
MISDMSNIYIDKILKENKITDYLKEKGFFPARTSKDKILYRCPLHEGDRDPSFIVYPVGTKGRNYQTYYCFGCKSGVNIINLKMELEKISSREAIKFFLKGINVNPAEAMESIIDYIGNDILEHESENSDDENKDIEFLMLFLGHVCRNYLNEYGDEEEIDFFDNVFFKKVDKIAMSNDVDTLTEYHNMLMDRNILSKRAEKVQKRREQERASAMAWII